MTKTILCHIEAALFSNKNEEQLVSILNNAHTHGINIQLITNSDDYIGGKPDTNNYLENYLQDIGLNPEIAQNIDHEIDARNKRYSSAFIIIANNDKYHLVQSIRENNDYVLHYKSDEIEMIDSVIKNELPRQHRDLSIA